MIRGWSAASISKVAEGDVPHLHVNTAAQRCIGMRLLSRTNGVLSLTPDRPPQHPYAILSHRWLAEEEEVSYTDLTHNVTVQSKAGYRKLDFCLQQAEKDGLSYVWVDTCCICKHDPKELGKALNAMFSWYAQAEVCYVYLADVEYDSWKRVFHKSDWFTRGWTLQELMVPRVVRFFSEDQRYIGDRNSLKDHIESATGIEQRLSEASLADRFSWSLDRRTSEPEDQSYCLLGLLDVPLLANYGEGHESAQERLFSAIETYHGRIALRKIREVHAEHKIRLKKASAKAAQASQLTEEDLMQSLNFSDMIARRDTIQTPFPRTCAWLLSHPDYARWVGMTGDQFLWIKGNPGAGKSTLVKFADSSSRSSNTHITISFYFNARGGDLEKSVLGLYRALLFQILYHAPQLRPTILMQWAQETSYSGSTIWTIARLQTALRQAFGAVQQQVQCFIDALDECDDSEIQDMVYFLEDMTKVTPKLFMCFASRHYPAISIESVQLILDEQSNHSEDLRRYVDGRLNADSALKVKVIHKANGIFLWAVLVVRLLNQELSKGMIFNLQKRLDELPGELIELIRDLVSREGDLEHFRVSLRWILFARQPLSVKEFYCAMLTDLSISATVDTAAFTEPWNQAYDSDMMSKFISSTSRGLAELARESVQEALLWRKKAPLSQSEHRVQFIHESVRDYLLIYGGLQEVYSNVRTDISSWMHNALKSTCYQYLLSLDYKTTFLMARSPEQQKEHECSVLERHPFLQYAHKNLLYHTDEAAAYISQDEFIPRIESVLCAAHKERHTKILFWYSDVVYVLAINRASRLIRAAHRLGHSVNNRCNGSLPLEMAIRMRSTMTVKALVDCGANLELPTGNASTALFFALTNRAPVEICDILLQGHADPDGRDLHGQTLLQYSIALQTMSKTEDMLKYIKLLLQYGADSEIRNHEGFTPLMLASLCNDSDLAALLLKCNVPTDSTDWKGRTALMYAAADGRADIVKVLLENKADSTIRNASGATAMYIACTNGHAEKAVQRMERRLATSQAPISPAYARTIECIKMLLEATLIISQPEREALEKLFLTSSHLGDQEMVKYLLERGIRPVIHEPERFVALYQNKSPQHREILSLLGMTNA